MKEMGLNELREIFLEFFESKNHLRLKSFSLIPKNDKSLLLINSGMAPLKSFFTGQEIPPSKRVTTCQKCIRTGDIENVGKTDRHGTFFEMLGNFSFGDYFKEEVIPWAWEFVTEVLEFPVEKLYISVYQDDDETFEIWNKKIGVDASKIVRLGKEDNFWEVGLGPCGPCSEIYFDRGIEHGCGSPDCAVGCECDRFIEFWNLVFTQFNKEEDGSYSKLKFPNIDTGMGLERIATIMQNVTSIFDVDTIKSIRDEVCKISEKKYKANAKDDISIRIITDHIRSATFMTADGVIASNEGRGYVLRRLIRRAIRHGKLLGINNLFLKDLCKVVIENSKNAYPELEDKKEYILRLLTSEENRFYETLDKGLDMLKDLIKNMKSDFKKNFPGVQAFKLYDTYGFPIELMKEILNEEDIDLDEEDFNKEMEAQKIKAKTAREETNYMGSSETIYLKIDKNIKTDFIGYENLDSESKIMVIIKDNEIVNEVKSGDSISIILDKTPFYAESGGQKGDQGIIKTKNGLIKIFETIKVTGGKIASLGSVVEGIIKNGDVCYCEASKSKRLNTERNHTATHLLQKALREVLGNHVEQAGSLVSREKLRFDFTHFEALTSEQILQVETLVNNKILESIDVKASEKNINEAKKLGAIALFGEKYGEIVRVVEIGDYSVELCGGTHVKNTSQICIFKIVFESGIAAGVRRIEAITGQSAFAYYKEINQRINKMGDMLKTAPDNILNKVEFFINQSKSLSKELEKTTSKLLTNMTDNFLKDKENIDGIDIITLEIKNSDIEELRKTADKIKDRINDYIIVLSSYKDEKVNTIVMCSESAVKKGLHSGNIVKQIATIVGGSGGGKANSAQAGGKDKNKMDEALKKAKEIIKESLSIK